VNERQRLNEMQASEEVVHNDLPGKREALWSKSVSTSRVLHDKESQEVSLFYEKGTDIRLLTIPVVWMIDQNSKERFP